MRSAVVIVSLVLLTSPARAEAQATLPPVDHKQTLSANPFGLMLNWINVEYERKLSDVVTIGASASNLESSFDDLLRGTMFVRFYPQRAALSGTYVGVRAGVLRQTGTHRETDRSFAAGVELGRSWLMGPNQNVSFSVGIGVDRIVGRDNGYGGVDAIPTFRLINVGIAF